MVDTRAAPYAGGLRAKGWRFELDLERVIQSDTWALAAEIPMAQHTLLMMWTVAWMQVPCGSMPADPELIRAKVKVPQKLWKPMQAVVMRGWWLADDGRLYHDTITERVLGMLSTKDAERVRKAEYRARKDAERQAGKSGGVPDMSHGTSDGHDGDGRGKDDTGTGTRTGIKNTMGGKPPVAEPPAGFLRFWAVWPPTRRKEAKGECARVWRERGYESVADTVVAHVEARKRTDWLKENGQYVEAPVVYLRAKPWEGSILLESPGELVGSGGGVCL